MMRSANPALSDKAFNFPSPATRASEAMTIQGTINKTAVMLLLCVATSWYTFQNPSNGLMILGVVGGLICALVTVFKKKAAPVSAPLYALLEGLALGGISAMYESAYGGIVFQAISLTFSILFAMLFIYKTGIIKVTQNFRIAVAAATGGIMLVYLVGFIMSFFGSGIPLIHGSGKIGIGFSLIVIGIASMNLVMDFDFIERASESGRAPKYMEWYGAFGLMVTLIWLYLELLRLLGKLNRR